MLHYKLVLTTVVLSIFFIPLNINAQNDKNELVQKLINEARQLNLKIDESKIVTRSIGGDGDIAAVPLITDSILNVTSEAIEKGEVYTSLQCMKTKLTYLPKMKYSYDHVRDLTPMTKGRVERLVSYLVLTARS
ncbi:unnamed protein product, partial [Rotaria sp. Silwood2]